MEEFSIQSPIIRNYTLEAMAAKSLKRENIITPKHKYIRLFINGEYLGVRHLEETVSRELIEANQRRYGPVFSLDETISTVYENAEFDLADKKTGVILNWVCQLRHLLYWNFQRMTHLFLINILLWIYGQNIWQNLIL